MHEIIIFLNVANVKHSLFPHCISLTSYFYEIIFQCTYKKRYWFIIQFGLFCPTFPWQVPYFNSKFPDLYPDIFPNFPLLFVIARVLASKGFLRSLSTSSTRTLRILLSRKGGKYETGKETKYFCVSVHETIILRYLLRQYQIWTQLTVRIPVPQGTGETISMDHMGVQSCDQNCDTTINPGMHVWNGYLHFCWHELTQTSKYD